MRNAQHVHYVEPYAGGLAVLLAKDPEGVSEVVNDVNSDLTNFWQVLQDEGDFARFKRVVEAFPFSQAAWENAQKRLTENKGADSVARAVWFFVLCRQSMAGRMKDFAPLSRRRVRRGMNEQVSAWLTAVEGLPEVHNRLKRVVVLNRPAVEVIGQEDGPQTIFYLDPPYVKDTRTAPDVYEHEMTDAEHQFLIDLILDCEGKFVVSMYHHPIYDFLATRPGWKVVEVELPNNAASGSSKRRMQECLFHNF